MPPERIERKLAAILAADVAGYSRLMGFDEEGTLARLKACRGELIDPEIAEHRGRVVKTTGDGILIEFPSVVDAVRCAMDVQRGMAERNADVTDEQRIEFRVGINLGDIMIDAEDIHGDGVNIAARLEGIAEPGGICISDSSYQQVRDKLTIDFEDMGEQQLKNIARPVRVYRLPIGRSAPRERPALALPDKPSIAVLPFQNMSGDPEQEYFADGMVEDIITALSRFKSLFVIARNSSFTYKGKAVDIRQVGRELGVRYVLEGSVRKAGSRLRIDVFELQDHVTEKVVTALAPRLEQAEIDRSRRKTAANLGAYDCYLRGLACQQQVSKQSIEEALPLLRHAIELDPELAPAYGPLLQGYAQRKAFGTVLNPDEENAEVARLVHIVLRIGKDDAAALSNTGWAVAYVLRDLPHAKSLVDRAVALNPNLAHAWATSGWINVWSGNPAVAVEYLTRAMRHDPLHGDRLLAMRSAMAHALFFLDKYDEAMAWAGRILRENPASHPGLRIFVASAAYANKTDEAREIGTRLRAIDPEFRISRLASYLGPYQKPEFLEKYAEGLRLADLPE